METRAAIKHKPKDDKSIINAHLLPAFGETPLRQITPQKVSEFSAVLSVDKAHNTVRNILKLLNAMLNQAVEWGWLERAPKILKPRKRACDVNYKYLRTQDEIDRFLTASKAHPWSITYPMFSTAIYTGMRAGELAGLRWDDIDFSNRLILVQRSFAGPTKSGKSRYVPIVDCNLPVLKTWKLACGSKRHVFPNNRKKMWDQSGRIFQEVLHNVLKSGGFPPRYITFHSLRHTFASHWVMRGGQLYELQTILGHADPTMTQRYAHLAPAVFEKAWGIFGDAREEKKGVLIEMKDMKTSQSAPYSGI